jgi:small basic protein
MRKTAISIIGALISTFIPVAARAQVPDVFREYITYGNFNVMVSAFEKVALFMSDTSYNTFVFIALLFGVLVWAAGSFTNLIRARDLKSWMPGIVIIFMGATIYIHFIVPKSDLLIYDEPSNRSMLISQVPDGLALLAGIQNQFVRGAVDMIWTTSDPLSYRQNAKGDIFNIMTHVFENRSFVPSMDDSTGKNLSQSIQRYFQDCVLFETSRPGTNINTNAFFANASILDVMAQARSPSVFTVYYDLANPAGYDLSCEQSYASIEMSLNIMAAASGTNEKFWTERCERAGYYDYTGALGDPAQQICQDKVVDFLSLYFTPVDALSLMKQHLVSNQIFNYIKLNDLQMLTDFKVMTAARGQASASLRWLPLLKSVVFAVYIGLTPFIFLLMPTPAFPRVLQFFFGIFVFMTSWEICDALLHSYAMDSAIATFREILNNGLSMKSLWMMESESINAMMIFGKLRWASMILASILSAVLSAFGGLAMAHFASMVNLGAHGSRAASETLQPDERGSRLTSLPAAAPTEAITNEHAWNHLQNQNYFRRKGQIVGDSTIIAGHQGPTAAGHVAGQIEDFGFSDREQRMGATQDTAAANSTSVQEALYKPHRSTAERSYARADVDSQDDFALAGTASSYGSLSEKAAYIKNRAMDDIKRDGEISGYTQENLDTLSGIAEGRMAFLNAPAVSSNLNPAEKANLSRWLNTNGYEVGRLGSQATMNFALDSGGNIAPSGINTFEGHKGAGGINFSQSHGEFIHMAITPENRLVLTQNGSDLEFIAGTLTGHEGGYHQISDGVTSSGQLINGTIDPDGNLIKTTHPSPLEVSSTSMLNLLSNNALPGSHMNVIDNQGAAVQAYVDAVRTYAQKSGIDTSAWDYAIRGFAGAYGGYPHTRNIGITCTGRPENRRRLLVELERSRDRKHHCH